MEGCPFKNIRIDPIVAELWSFKKMSIFFIAEKSGLQRGDVFVKLDDTEIKNCEQFMMRVQHLDRRFKMESRAKNIWPPKGFSVNAVVLRGGVQKNVTLNLEWTSF